MGLVHGLGFSTALSDLLETSGPDLMSRLLFFNLGIELGQLVIVGLSYPLLQILRRQSEFIEHYGNRIIVYPVVAIAVFWTVNRFLDLLNLLLLIFTLEPGKPEPRLAEPGIALFQCPVSNNSYPANNFQ